MSEENVFLWYAVRFGVFITFVYDWLRILRRVIPHKGFFVSLEDLLFWAFCAGEVFLLLYRESNGNLRWFAVLGALAGMLVYKRTLSGPFVRWTSLLLSRLFGILGKISAFLTRPVGRAGRAGGSFVKKFMRQVKIRLKNYGRMLKMRICKH